MGKVLIVEDDKIQLGWLKIVFSSILDSEPDCFSSGEEAISAMAKSVPAIIFTDIGMPGMGGLEFISRARELSPECAIVVISGFDDPETIFRALKAGAIGYLIKPVKKPDIKKALDELELGGSPISPGIARLIINEFRSREIPTDLVLSIKEQDVLQKVTDGLTYKEAAEALNLSIHTVHWHMKNISAKLYAKNKKDVILKAKMRGLVD